MDPNLLCIYTVDILYCIIGLFNLYYRGEVVEILINYVIFTFRGNL